MLFGTKGGAEWLFVFLGNPGPRYAGTRHNAGFMVGEALSKSLGVKINRARWRALTATADVSGHKVLLMLPQTLMNLSGEAVGPAAKFYKLPPERVLVFSDEMALPPGSAGRARGSTRSRRTWQNPAFPLAGSTALSTSRSPTARIPA